MKASEIREMTDAERVAKLEDLRREYLNLRFAHATQQLESPAKLRNARRDIARLNTIMTDKKKVK
jgi:large subunit ribosomal protein L29